jgi:hypothetical protein
MALLCRLQRRTSRIWWRLSCRYGAGQQSKTPLHPQAKYLMKCISSPVMDAIGMLPAAGQVERKRCLTLFRGLANALAWAKRGSS